MKKILKTLFAAASLAFCIGTANASTFKTVQIATAAALVPTTTGYHMVVDSGTITVLNTSTFTASKILGVTQNLSSSTYSGTNDFKNGISVTTPTVAQPMFEVAKTSADFTMNGSSRVVITPSQTWIKGVTDASDASAGGYGEYISSSAVGAVNFPASTVIGDLRAIPLTAGDWDITCGYYALLNGATLTNVIFALSSTPGNSSSGWNEGITRFDIVVPTTNNPASGSMPPLRVSLTTLTTYYLKFDATYTGGPPQALGKIQARRVR